MSNLGKSDRWNLKKRSPVQRPGAFWVAGSRGWNCERSPSPMVRPGVREGDDDLGPMTDRTDWIEGRAVTASSRGARGRHSISDIPSTSTPIEPNYYMPWFLPRTHLRIQNPDKLSCGVQLPMAAPITRHVLLEMISRELDCDDIDDAMKLGRAFDMIKKYHLTRGKT
ncbi:hypothetical protein M9H77_30700 [Catharanthus roseus]|uniref:Uncharacterized protein n=1 Tax=Catharanthus roseus TaxID=4058 RepID=A0ACC0A2A0_CATRO|nr:hypothetical protein M9H77_30700 [Catharanthus roseus]